MTPNLYLAKANFSECVFHGMHGLHEMDSMGSMDSMGCMDSMGPMESKYSRGCTDSMGSMESLDSMGCKDSMESMVPMVCMDSMESMVSVDSKDAWIPCDPWNPLNHNLKPAVLVTRLLLEADQICTVATWSSPSALCLPGVTFGPHITP